MSIIEENKQLVETKILNVHSVYRVDTIKKLQSKGWSHIKTERDEIDIFRYNITFSRPLRVGGCGCVVC